MTRISPWKRYVDAAVQPGHQTDFPARAATEARSIPHGHTQPLAGAAALSPRVAWQKTIQERLLAASPSGADIEDTEQPGRRGDLRLVPAAVIAWLTAVAGLWLGPAGLVVLSAGLIAAGGTLFAWVWRADCQARKRARLHDRIRDRRPPPGRSLLITLAISLLLAGAVAGHSAGASTQRHDAALADAIATKAAVTAELTVEASPRRLAGPANSGAGDRWATNVTAHSLTAKGNVIKASAQLLVMGGDEWQHVQAGQRLRTTGKLRSPEGGQAEAAILSGTSPPTVLAPAGPWNEGPGALRDLFRESSSSLPGDSKGLLPGMVTGDTSGLDEELNAAMKTVGLTHLTAVSGANCSLVLGALLLVARSFRLPRMVAAGCALAGLGFFVLVVGPDASVLRAALMGSIGLMALAGGRPGRGLSFLCLAVICLLLLDPSLGASYGFILSVLATLGIVTIGQQLVKWTPRIVPRWAAAGLAVPLSAQLLCSPVIVLLQPQFSPYALIANIVASPLVGPVTILGTAAVPLLPLAQVPGGILVFIAGFFAGCVAGTARFFASLPGASLPWPEGIFGFCTMLLLSCMGILGMWLVLHPLSAGRRLLLVHAALLRYRDRLADGRPFLCGKRGPPPGLVRGRHHEVPAHAGAIVLSGGCPVTGSRRGRSPDRRVQQRARLQGKRGRLTSSPSGWRRLGRFGS